MAFQNTVGFQFAAGIKGEVSNDGPHRTETMRLVANPDQPTALITFARAFGYADPADHSNPLGGTVVSVAMPGGSNFAGILINPKEHASYGTANGALQPVFTLPANSWGGICDMGFVWVEITAATAADGIPGAKIGYNALGELVAVARGGALPAGTTLIPGARLRTAIGEADLPVLAKIELTTIAAA